MELLSKIALLVLFLAVLMAGQGCYYDNEEDLYPGFQQCDTIAPTWSNRLQPLISSKCATPACHSGISPSAGLRLDTYEQVKTIALNGKLANRVIVQKNMPPSGPLPACDLEALQSWINAGAPQ